MMLKLNRMIQKYYVANKEKLMQNKIDQSILMKAYSKLCMFDDLEQLYSKELLAKDAYYYYMGMHYCNIDDKRGTEYWKKYIDFLKNTSFEESDIYFTEAIIEYFNCLYLYYSRHKNLEKQKNVYSKLMSYLMYISILLLTMIFVVHEYAEKKD